MAIAFVNAAANFVAGTGTTIAAPATSLSTGNLLVVAVRIGAVSLTQVTGIADTAGNLYRIIPNAGGSSSGASVELWFANNCVGNASNIVTATLAPTVSADSIVTMQFSGASLVPNPWDVVSATSVGTTSATPTVVAFTTKVANQVIVFAAQIENTGKAWTAGSGFTLPAAAVDASDVCAMQYQIVSSIQTGITPSITSADSTSSKSCACATFIAPVDAGGGGTTGYGFAG